MSEFLLLTLIVALVDLRWRAQQAFHRWFDGQPPDVQERIQGTIARGY